MIVIPAAGEGRRFREAGYEQPKHEIPLGGIRLIDRVIRNVLPLDTDGDVTVITRAMVGETRGTAETIALAADKIPLGKPVVVANCDQLIWQPKDWQPRDGQDAVVFTFRSCNEAHSYVSCDEDDRIIDIVEKQVISERAVSGVYWFRDSGTLMSACLWLCGYRRTGELYLSGALKRMLDLGYALYAVDVPTAILGTPEDFQRYEVALAMAAAA